MLRHKDHTIFYGVTKAELLAMLDDLPDDTMILPQVVGADGSTWTVDAEVSGVLNHFKWDTPVACLTISHPNLLSVNPDAKWG